MRGGACDVLADVVIVHTFTYTALLVGLVACGACGPGGNASSSEDDMNGASPEFIAYVGVARRHGLSPPSAGKPVFIGIRGQDTTGARHPTKVGHMFDDQLVILTPDLRLVKLAMSTHPFETGSTSSGVPDVDHDGHADVGMIRPGRYVANRRSSSRDILGVTTYQVFNPTGTATDHIAGFRNTDHDDTYSDAERSASEARKDTLTDILFHVGGPGAPEVVGCQVLQANDMRRVATEGGAHFDYLLVDANEEDVP
jgi:hypothetical protein